jgi:hypothetical protein
MNSPSTARRRPFTLLASLLLAASLGISGCGGGSGDPESAAKDAADQGIAAPGRAADGTTVGGRGQPGDAAGTGTGAAGSEAAGGTADKRPPKLVAAQVIRTATLTLRVKDVTAALGDARTAAESAGGYLGDETTDRDAGGHERSRVVLRVPQAAYEDVLEELAGTGRLLERRVSTQDVTDQVVDVESRVASQRASVARVRDLMERATTLADVVALEGELSSRQAELEALQAQQARLTERTSLATITLVLSETAVQPKPREDDETSFLDALAGGWDAFVTTLRWIAVALGAMLPFAAALALLVLLWRTVRSRLPKRPAGAPGTPAAPAAPAAPGVPGVPGSRGVTPPRPVAVPGPVTPGDGEDTGS